MNGAKYATCEAFPAAISVDTADFKKKYDCQAKMQQLFPCTAHTSTCTFLLARMTDGLSVHPIGQIIIGTSSFFLLIGQITIFKLFSATRRKKQWKPVSSWTRLATFYQRFTFYFIMISEETTSEVCVCVEQTCLTVVFTGNFGIPTLALSHVTETLSGSCCSAL